MHQTKVAAISKLKTPRPKFCFMSIFLMLIFVKQVNIIIAASADPKIIENVEDSTKDIVEKAAQILRGTKVTRKIAKNSHTFFKFNLTTS